MSPPQGAQRMSAEATVFPFGRPNSLRPPRRPDGPVEVLVLGVYPSAFHVRWWRPEATDGRPRGDNFVEVDTRLADQLMDHLPG